MRYLRAAFPFVIILTVFLIDQITKSAILTYFYSSPKPVELTGFFNLVLAWNTGVSFNLLSSDSVYMPHLLAGFSILVSLFLLIWLVRENSLLIKCGLAFVIAGAIGNAADRLQYGAVVDFLHFFYGNWHFPAFNVADISINVGVGLILIDALFFSSKKPKTTG